MITTPSVSGQRVRLRPFASEAERATAIEVWNIHCNYHRPHTAARNQPPALKLSTGVTNVLRSNS
jgi:hypothetical protein